MKANDRENGLYDKGKRCAIAQEEEHMMGLLAANSKGVGHVLDLGCGSGEISASLKSLGYNVKGLDFSSSAIAIAKQSGLDCQVADLDEGIPFGDQQFDVVWAGDVIEHVFDPISVLSEAKRVLGHSGVLLATIPYDLSWKTRIRTLLGKSYQEGVYRSFGQFKHHSFFSESLMRYMYERAELEIERVDYLLINPFTGKRSISNKKYLRIFSNLMIVVASPKRLREPATNKNRDAVA